MIKVKLIDYFGFTIGQPEISKPLPQVIVWGNEFFLINDQDVHQGCETLRYHMTSGFVVSDTKEHSTRY